MEDALRSADDALEIIELHGLWSDPRVSLYWLARGTALRERGDLSAGAEALERSLAVRRTAGRLNPTISLQVVVAVASIRFELGDPVEAEKLLDEAREIADAIGDAGDFSRRIQELATLVRASGRRLEFGEVLSERELQILRLLSTDLPQRGISAQLYLSINTVKSHTRAIYRKLGVTSRTDAVRKGRELELVIER
jgi:LuxR family maltose regulon positive regulatory protein